MILTVIFYIFVACTAIQIVYYLIFSSVLFSNKNKELHTDTPPISLIIYVKNSGDYLSKNLKYFKDQNYPNFEILLVNNASIDNTDDILEDIREHDKSIRILDVENNESFWGNKKYTYTLAIKAAKHEHLLFSEIDVKPISKNWIVEMSKQFSLKKSIVLGYKKYSLKSSLTNLVIRLDNLLHTLKSFSFAKFNSGFSASSKNYAFKKSEFFRVKGFINHIKIREGKDDLFIKDAINNHNITFSNTENSFVECIEKTSLKQWFTNKRNQLKLQNKYSLKNKFLLFLFSFTKYLTYILCAVLFFFYPWKHILLIIISYFVTQFIVMGIATKKFKETHLIFLLPVLDIYLVLIQITIFISNLISKSSHWK